MKKYLITYITYEVGNLYDISKGFIDNQVVEARNANNAYEIFKNRFWGNDYDYVRIINIIELGGEE